MTVTELPAGFDRFVEEMVELGQGIAGHLSARDIRFLCLAAVASPASGEILEIGSFQGKSTVVLAKSSRFAGRNRVVAVDPLSFPSETDPAMEDKEALPEVFRGNLARHGVESLVEFHQMPSQELGLAWDRSIRLLWIDGDHTLRGARRDLETFLPHLADGAIVAIHDVMHGFEGPDRVMCEDVLLSPDFGACGICGSVGWSQYVRDESVTAVWRSRKLGLHRALSRMIPHVTLGAEHAGINRRLYQFKRWLVPHGDVRPAEWVRLLVPGAEA